MVAAFSVETRAATWMKPLAAGSVGTVRKTSWSAPNAVFQVALATPPEMPVRPLLLIATMPPSWSAGDCQFAPRLPAVRVKLSSTPVRGNDGGGGGGGRAAGVAET